MNKSELQFSEPGNRYGHPLPSKPVHRHRFLKQVTSLRIITFVALMALQIAKPVHAQNADEVRKYISAAVGGLDKLTVPPTDASIPVPAGSWEVESVAHRLGTELQLVEDE